MAYQQYSGVFTNTQAAQAKGQDKWVSSTTITAVDGDDNFADTTLLLQGNGSNGGNNNGFVDNSNNSHTITRTNNITQGSFSPFSQDEGKWGNYFDGDGDYLQLADSTDFVFGTGDFTIEFWVYSGELTTDSIDPNLIDLRPSSTNGVYPTIFYDSSADNLVFYVSAVGRINGGALSEHTWHHIAVARSGTSTKMFVDGTQVGSTYTDTNNYLCGSNRPLIGAQGYTPSATTRQLNGYMSNVRLVKGTAVYTSDFTPPTEPLTDITNTSLLTCQSNRFVDNSSNAHSITVNGDTKVVPFSPFVSSTAYDPATNGASGYSPNSSSYLTAPWSIMPSGTEDFTIEFWFYQDIGGSSAYGVVGDRPASNNNWQVYAGYPTNGVISLLFNDSTLTVSSTRTTGEWTHYAWSREGNTFKSFKNGELANTSTSSLDVTKSFTNSYIFWAGFTAGAANAYMSDLRIIRGTALYTSSFDVPTEPLTAVSNTSFLLNFENASIIDGTGKSALETVGDAQIDTAVKKYGTGSMQFDGTGDYLRSPYSPLYRVGSEDYTAECWVYPTVLSGDISVIGWHTADEFGGWALGFDGTTVRAWINFGSWVQVTGGTIATDQWSHIALIRNGSSFKIAVNGTLGTELTNSNAVNNTDDSDIIIGGRYDGTGNLYTGFVDDVRITKGFARYTENFTPSTEEFLGFGDSIGIGTI